MPIGLFIADFAALGARLVVEVDGGYHIQRRALDALRDRDLARLGYRVLRLDADFVVQQPLEAVALSRELPSCPLPTRLRREDYAGRGSFLCGAAASATQIRVIR